MVLLVVQFRTFSRFLQLDHIVGYFVCGIVTKLVVNSHVLSGEDVELSLFSSLGLGYIFCFLKAVIPRGESFFLTRGWYFDIRLSGGLIFRVHCLAGGGTPRV